MNYNKELLNLISMLINYDNKTYTLTINKELPEFNVYPFNMCVNSTSTEIVDTNINEYTTTDIYEMHIPDYMIYTYLFSLIESIYSNSDIHYLNILYYPYHIDDEIFAILSNVFIINPKIKLNITLMNNPFELKNIKVSYFGNPHKINNPIVEFNDLTHLYYCSTITSHINKSSELSLLFNYFIAFKYNLYIDDENTFKNILHEIYSFIIIKSNKCRDYTHDKLEYNIILPSSGIDCIEHKQDIIEYMNKTFTTILCKENNENKIQKEYNDIYSLYEYYIIDFNTINISIYSKHNQFIYSHNACVCNT